MKRKSQKITGSRSKYRFPVDYPEDRGHYKIRAIDTLTTTSFPEQKWDNVAKRGPLAGYMNYLQTPGSLLASSTFNDAGGGSGSTSLDTIASNNYPGDDVVGQTYDYAYVASVSISWTVTRSDDSSDYPVHFLMAPVSTTQLDYFGSQVTSGTKRVFFPGPSDVPDHTAWGNSILLHGAVHSKVGSIKGSSRSKTIKLHIPLKKYLFPGYPTALPDVSTHVEAGVTVTNSWLCKTNGGGYSGWNFPDGAHQCYLYMCLYFPIAGAPDTRLTHSVRATWYVTGVMARIPSRIFWGAVEESGGGSGATGPGGTGTFPPDGPSDAVVEEESKEEKLDLLGVGAHSNQRELASTHLGSTVKGVRTSLTSLLLESGPQDVVYPPLPPKLLRQKGGYPVPYAD